MKVTNIHEAKTHFSKLVDRAAAGEEVIIGKAGTPMVKLVPYQPAKPVRKPGAWKGQIHYLKDWAESDKEIEALFYAEPLEPPIKPAARHPRPAVVAGRKSPPRKPRTAGNR
jgi:prevent-host-death family protein